MTASRHGNGILIMPESGLGWLFHPGEMGWAWAQAVLTGASK